MSKTETGEKSVRVTCKSAVMMALEGMEPFQGDLKATAKADMLKLKRSIVRYGFTAPMAIWRNGEKNMILDGHQRMIALKELKLEGWKIPPIPVTVIEAKTKQEAKEKLLALVSVYGKVDKAGLKKFLITERISIGTLSDVMNIPDIKIEKVVIETNPVAQAPIVEEYDGMSRIVLVYNGKAEQDEIAKRLGIEITDRVMIYRYQKNGKAHAKKA